MIVVSLTQNKLILFESNEAIVPLKSTIGSAVMSCGCTKDSAAIDVEKWMVYDEEVPLSMLVRVIFDGTLLTTISTAVLCVPLGVVHDVNFALLSVSWAFAATVSSKTAPFPLFRAIFENSVWRVVEETVREDIEGTLVRETTETRGEEESLMPLKETPMRERDPVEETERNEEVSGVVDVCVNES